MFFARRSLLWHEIIPRQQKPPLDTSDGCLARKDGVDYWISGDLDDISLRVGIVTDDELALGQADGLR